MQANLLILHPSAADETVQAETLLPALRDIGFIGETMDFQGESHYRPGEEFLQLVTFLGCSPVVSLGEPGKTGEEFCHIGLHAPTREPVLIAGANAKAPRCPFCRQPDGEWQRRISPGEPVRNAWTCPHCGQQSPAHKLNWRQSAGIGRTFIVVWGIFEGEAVPSEQLLSTLENTGAGPWTYFYYRGDAPL